MKNIIINVLRYIVAFIVAINMYWIFYIITNFIWGFFASLLPLFFAIIPPIIVWLFLQYGTFWKILKPLKINRYYYLIINILGLIYAFIKQYISYVWFLETNGDKVVSERFQHLTFLQESLLTLIGLFVIIYIWKNNYRSKKICKD